MIAAATMLWSIVSIIVEGFTLASIVIIVSLGCSFIIIRIPNLKFCQIFVFILQVTACAFIPLNKNQTETAQHWRIYLNGAASMLWLFMGYQAFLFELISIIVAVVVPILTLNVENEYIVVCVLFVFLLTVQRYLHNLGQRRLFLALQSLQQWEEAIEKTVPSFFMIQRFEFVTHQMYLQNSNRNFTRFLEGQNKQKGKTKGENISNNKAYIDFLKNCEIETGITVMPQSPAAFNQQALGSPNYSQNKIKSQSGDFGSNSYRKRSANFLSSCQNLGQNNIANGNQTFSGSLQIPLHQMKLFDFLLAKHDKLLQDYSRKEQKKPISWHSLTQSILKKSRWILTGSSTNEDPSAKKNSFPVVGEENNMAREDTLKVSYKGNNFGSPVNMLLRVKIIGLSSPEPLLAIQMQDITSTEEEKKGKQVEQENTLVILQALQQAKKNLDFLKSNLLTIKTNLSLRQAVYFPLNIIRSTCIIDKTKLQYNPFYLSSLLRDIQGVCGNNLSAICIKHNSQADLGDSILEEAIRLKSIKEQVISGDQQGTLQNINLSMSNLNNDMEDDESQENPYYLEDPNDFNEENDQQDYSNTNFLKQFPYRSKYVFLGQENSIRLPVKHLSQSVEQQEIQRNLIQYSQQQTQVLMSIPSLSKLTETQGGSETIGQNNSSNTQINSTSEAKQLDKKSNLMLNIPRSNQILTTPQGSSKLNLPPKRTNIIPRQEKQKLFTKSISNGNLQEQQQQVKVKKSTSSNSLVNNQQNQSNNEKKFKLYEDKLPNNFMDKNNLLPQYKKIAQIGTMKLNQNEIKRSSQSDLTIHFHETPIPPSTLPYLQDSDSNKLEDRKKFKSAEKIKIPIMQPSKTMLKEDQQKHPKNDQYLNDNAISEADSLAHFSSLGIEFLTNGNISSKYKKDFPSSSNIQKIDTTKWSYDSRQPQSQFKTKKDSHGYGLNTRNEIGCIYDDSEISDTELAQSGITMKVGAQVTSGKQNLTNNQGECLVYNNQQLIFQVITSLLTSFGERKVKLLVEQVHNRLYSSLKFVFKAQEVPQQTYNTLNEDQVTVITAQSPQKQHNFEFGFQNASDSQQQLQQQTNNIPLLFTYPYNNIPKRNTIQNSFDQQQQQQQTQLQQKMMMNLASDNRPYPKLKFNEQQQTFCTSSADLCNKKQSSSEQQQNSQGINEQEPKETQEIQSKNQKIQEEHIKCLYGLNYSNNKQLMNKIWKNLKEITSILGPGTIDCQQNCISVEFFVDMNVVRKDSSQQASMFSQSQFQNNLPQSHSVKPSRISIFSQINSSHNFHHFVGAQTPLGSSKNNNPSFTNIPASQSPLMAKHHYFKQDSGLGVLSTIGGQVASAKNISNHFFPSSFNLQASKMSSNDQGNSKNFKEESNNQDNSSSKYGLIKHNELIPEEEERHVPVVQHMGSTNSDYFQSVLSQDEGNKSVQSVKHFQNQTGQFN